MPKIVEAMEVRHEVYNRQMAQINEKEARGEILVIRPPESLGISRTEHDPNELERVYQTGRREAYRMLPKIRAFLKE
jgi:predicted patatin/cPLA2 family phospholipase